MGLPDGFLEELRARTSLAGIIGRKVKLERRGRELKGCCPFHNEKTPSFHVYDDHYHCFGCGAHGDAISFLREQEGLDFMGAVHRLAAEAGMAVPERAADPAERRRSDARAALEAAAAWYQAQLGGIGGAEARAYLGRRDIDETLVRVFGLGLAPETRGSLTRALTERLPDAEPGLFVEAGLVGESEDGHRFERFRGRLMFPIHDQRGRPVGFGGRILGVGEPKYLNSPEGPLFAKGRLLYNLHRAAPAARKAGRLLLVEGYMDVIGLARAGIMEAAAPLGTAVTEDQLALAWRVAEVPILAMDGDSAGRRAALKAALRALPGIGPTRSLAFALLPPGQDPDDLARRGGSEAVEKVLAGALPLDRFLFETEAADARLDTPEGQQALLARLMEHAGTIADRGLRKAYEARFRDAHFALLRARRDKGRDRWRPGDRPRTAIAPPLAETRAAAGNGATTARLLLLSIAARRGAAERHAEALAALDLPDQSLARLRDALVAGEPVRISGPVIGRDLDDTGFDSLVGQALACLDQLHHIDRAMGEPRDCSSESAMRQAEAHIHALREARNKAVRRLSTLVMADTA
ncbi:MAG: DNA primase [Thermaurantiacus sp.]